MRRRLRIARKQSRRRLWLAIMPADIIAITRRPLLKAVQRVERLRLPQKAARQLRLPLRLKAVRLAVALQLRNA